MKNFYRITPWKHLLFLLPAFIFFEKAHPQPIVVHADPGVVSFDITDMNDISVPANLLFQNSIYKLKFNIFNGSQLNTIPDQTAIITIGLGTKLILNPTFDLSTAPFNNYFQWLSQTSGGQVQIAGILHTALPADFDGTLVFIVKANVSGGSTISGNFNVSNNNPLYTLTDDNPNNNSASLSYLITAQSPLPVTITKFAAVKKDCNININWSVEQELNFLKYELEVSKDGISFTKVDEIPARNLTQYKSNISLTDQLKAPSLYFRLKSIDIDGQFKYSQIVSVAGTCDSKSQQVVYSYPNPVSLQDYITIASKGNLFNGKYQLSLTDIAGKALLVSQVELTNVASFRYNVSNKLAAGKYFISIRKADGSAKSVIQFEKL